ncbi:MAG: response regulator [Gammaproteobacteria bacterium]|jgi:two-component system repressor protein LuxO|nr:response regulator [Gammaproteobacteria bacterium]
MVEDSPSLAATYKGYLRDEPWELLHVTTGAEALEVMKDTLPQALLLDLQLPDMDGMDILRHIHAAGMPTVVVVITAHGSIDIAVDAMRYQAFDFLTKPFDAERLRVTLRNALDRQQLSRMVEVYKENFDRDSFHGFIGSALPMQTVYRIIESAAPSKATVFITGESGTGKELCADAIHKQSPRAEKPFVVVNCAAIPKDLMESEIFGHVKGAFTGAASERRGAASRADGGTLFLDEICEMDFDLQSKLLRFVQTSTFQKVGGSNLETVDVRFVCATNRDPAVEVDNQRFREDLFYRLQVIPIHLPPLREREEDVINIARAILTRCADEEGKSFERFAPEVEVLFRSYGWPGNVRQLENVIRNIVVLNDAEEVAMEMLPPPLDALSLQNLGALREQVYSRAAPHGPEPGTASGDSAPAELDIKPLWQTEKETIEQAIARCEGNIPKAAALLEVSASTIYRKRQAWEAQEG